MKLILTESQVKTLIGEIASLEDLFPNNPLNQVRDSISAEAPNIAALAKNLSDNGIGGTINKVKGILPTIKNALSGNNTINTGNTTNAQFAQNIPRGTEPMNPLGHVAPITSYYGPRKVSNPRESTFHNGIDFSTRSGSPVYAPLDGVVVSSKDSTPNPCGGFIQLKHATIGTKFCHLRQLAVKQGDNVKKGQLIGYTGGGATDPMHGDATGPHLHYEILDNGGMPRDPLAIQNNLVA
jgi:murein DD-endopeptidase MepM/ murein hydrolase activator NlpD